MRKLEFSCLIIAFIASTVLLPAATSAQQLPTIATRQRPVLGKAAPAPPNLPLNPPPGAPGIKPLNVTVTGGFAVDTDSREEVRSFYNAIYPTSSGVPQNSTADVTSCTPGHNDNAFQLAELRRINWFRAMAGMPASVYLDPIDNWGSQQMAVIISANDVLNHNPQTNYTCYNTFAAGYAGGDQALGGNGADATTLFIWDYGANNNEVGHRRWLLYPPEIVMGVGDVPGVGTNAAGNLTYVFDPASFGARPATRQPYVAWPPEGFAPYQVIYPYWSFALSNADFSAAAVFMKSNGVPVSTVIQPYKTGYGENTLVWVPMGLEGTTGGTSFPFDGVDTVYSVTVSNILYNSTPVSYSYTVTAFDPAVPGADYIPCALTGPAQTGVGVPTTYSATPPNNPHVTSYNYAVAQPTNGNLLDNANNGLTNFTIYPPPNYTVVTSEPFGSGNCFNLEHAGTNSYPQLFQLKEVLVPAANALLNFQSELGFASSDEVARVQISADGGQSWHDVYAQPGNDSYESSFTPHSLSLSNYAGQSVIVRFNYDFQGGTFYNSGFPIGWFFTGVQIMNSQAIVNQVTNFSSGTNIVSGNLVDSANAGLGNFTITPPPYYYAITNPPVGTESNCFHLTHLDPASQLMQFNEVLVPSASSSLQFSSQLAHATSDETARVQASTDNGATWTDLFVEAGSNGSGETSFTPHSLSLAAYAGRLTLLRFNYAFTGGTFYPQAQNYVGWNIEDIVLTNVQQKVVTITNTTNFTFTPAATGTYLLQAQPVIYNQFPLSFGPLKTVTVVSNSTPTIVLGTPVLAGQQVQLNFTVSGGSPSSFHLLQTAQANIPWTTNVSAVLTTNIPGSSYRFTVTNNAAVRFYRIQTP